MNENEFHARDAAVTSMIVATDDLTVAEVQERVDAGEWAPDWPISGDHLARQVAHRN